MSADSILSRLASAQSPSAQKSLTVPRELCLGPSDAKHLSGGACAAALVGAAEDAARKPLVQASAQFRRAPRVGETVEIVIDEHRPGRSIDLITASMIDGTSTCVLLSATLGRRRSIGDFNWETPPEVNEPETCGPIPFIRADHGDLHTHLDMRLAAKPKNGAMAFWTKSPIGESASISCFLALIADYLPEAIHLNIGQPAGAISLDNTLRIASGQLTAWTLCVTQLSAIHNGIFHGQMQIFNQDTKLVATASQSGIVRLIE